MPDHVRVLAAGQRDEADFREFVRVWKQRTAFHAKRDLGVRLWQRSFHEHLLRNDESTELAATYILANPVRKGLVDHPEQYPYLGSFVTPVRDLLERAQELESVRAAWKVGPYRADANSRAAETQSKPFRDLRSFASQRLVGA